MESFVGVLGWRRNESSEKSAALRIVQAPPLTVAAFLVSKYSVSSGTRHASICPFALQSVGARSWEMHARARAGSRGCGVDFQREVML